MTFVEVDHSLLKSFSSVDSCNILFSSFFYFCVASPQLSSLPTSFSESVNFGTSLVSLSVTPLHLLMFQGKKITSLFKTMNYNYLSLFPRRRQIPLRPDTLSYPCISNISHFGFFSPCFCVLFCFPWKLFQCN